MTRRQRAAAFYFVGARHRYADRAEQKAKQQDNASPKQQRELAHDSRSMARRSLEISSYSGGAPIEQVIPRMQTERLHHTQEHFHLSYAPILRADLAVGPTAPCDIDAHF
jgi:hypothetical protein